WLSPSHASRCFQRHGAPPPPLSSRLFVTGWDTQTFFMFRFHKRCETWVLQQLYQRRPVLNLLKGVSKLDGGLDGAQCLFAHPPLLVNQRGAGLHETITRTQS